MNITDISKLSEKFLIFRGKLSHKELIAIVQCFQEIFLNICFTNDLSNLKSSRN
jgi:hypothetical protein